MIHVKTYQHFSVQKKTHFFCCLQLIMKVDINLVLAFKHLKYEGGTAHIGI